MKIVYVSFSHPGGGDVYFDILSKHIDNSICIKLPRILEFFPFLIKFYIKKNFNISKRDIIHTNDHMAHFLKPLSERLVITIYHDVFDKEYQKYTTVLQKIYHFFWVKPNLVLSFKKANNIIAISKFTKESICKNFNIDNKMIQVIYPGIDTDLFSPFTKIPFKKNRSYFRLLFVGNVSKRKGFDLLPHIMDKLGNNYKLYFTSGLKNIKHIDKKFALRKNMFPLGRLSIDNLIKEYNDCDLFIFPSRLEGFGYAIAEAMSCGKPIVSTNYSSIPEIMGRGGGLLCQKDDVDCFVNAVKSILEKEGGEEYFIKNRKRIIENFSLDMFIKRMKNFYKNL